MADEGIGYVLQVFAAPGVAPERADFEDAARAEKAFTDAKFAAILWQSRPPTLGLGWKKLKQKDTPPVPAVAKPEPAAGAEPPKA